MPTYLVAITVGRFGNADRRWQRAFHSGFLRPKVSSSRQPTRWRVTRKVDAVLHRVFRGAYSLPKLDQLAVPGIRDGAMEDWGLISYSEDAILFNPARSSFDVQRNVFNIVAHEIAHQWFGNLVTAASWEEIWLNEAFATWMEIKASAHFNPGWHERLRRRPWLDQTMTLRLRPGDTRDSRRAVSESQSIRCLRLDYV